MSDDDKPRDYDPDEARRAIDRAFPFEPEVSLSIAFGLPKKVAQRWYSGYSRVPPHALAKIRRQAELRARLAGELERILAEADAAGCRLQIQRGVLMDVLKGGRFDVDEEPM